MSDCRGDERHDEQIRPDTIVVRRESPKAVVENAPPELRITLELIQASDPTLLTISGDLLHMGYDSAGEEITYRVIGWDPSPPALIVQRI